MQVSELREDAQRRDHSGRDKKQRKMFLECYITSCLKYSKIQQFMFRRSCHKTEWTLGTGTETIISISKPDHFCY